MAGEYSREALLDFLDFLGDRGMLKKATASSRKATANTVLAILNDDEARDLRRLDVDQIMERFANKTAGSFKPDSLKVYRSRLGISLIDFLEWKKDPSNFKLSGQRRRAQPNSAAKRRKQDTSAKEPSTQDRATKSKGNEGLEHITFPIPIRPGVIVHVSGVPSDLKPEEAQKIGNVILALSGSQEE